MINIRVTLRITFIIVFLTFILFPSLNAQDEEPDIVLPRSVEGEGIYNNDVKILIDGQSPAEGSPWDSPHNIYWENTDAFFLLDLGGVFQITGLLIQVDGNDVYNIEYSEDGTGYIPLIQIVEAHGNIASGMDTMSTVLSDPHYVVDLEFESVSARFIKVYATGGDNHFSVSEIQVYGYRDDSSSGAVDEGEGQIIRPSGIEASGNFSNSTDLIVDGRIPYEESGWDEPGCVFWQDVDTSFVIDLGDVYEVLGIVVQVDSDDDYRIEFSLSGDDFVPLVEILRADGEVTMGMDTMSSIPTHPEFISELEFFPVQARFIRIFALDGNGEFSVSEVQVFGRRPSI
ncbi:discoidin domain-containing protein [Acidobacteriota bacterium]